MKDRIKKSTDLKKTTKSSILSDVASKIKGKNLFPKKTEEAKKILDHARIVNK